jgi:hypothetical protein
VVILDSSGLESLAFGRPGIVGAEGRSAPDRRRSNLASDLLLRASRPHPASADVDIGVLKTA